MAIELNHTIVHADDPEAEAARFVELFGLPAARHFGHFAVVEFAHGSASDFAGAADRDDHQHDAFLVTEDEFTEIHDRIVERGIEHRADPGRSQPERIDHRDGGRGVSFRSPGGYLLEILTRPYGSGSS